MALTSVTSSTRALPRALNTHRYFTRCVLERSSRCHNDVRCYTITRNYSKEQKNDGTSSTPSQTQNSSYVNTKKTHHSQHIMEDDLSHRVIHKLSKIESRMKFRGYSVLRIGLGLVFVTGAGIYIFREYIRENVADEVSTVASRSLEDETLKLRAHVLSMALLEDLLNDVNMQSQAVRFLRSVIHHEDTQAAMKQLFANLLNDPETQSFLSRSLKQVVTATLDDDEFRKFLVDYFHKLLQDEQIRASLMQLVAQIFLDEHILEQASLFAKDVIATDRVQQEGVKLGQYIASGVVADEVVQKRTGDALWNAFTYSVKPNWMTSWLPSWMGGGSSSTPDTSHHASSTTETSIQPPESDQVTSKPHS